MDQRIFDHLNGSDDRLAPSEGDDGAALRRILGRLGEYVAQIVAPLNMRPTAATLLSECAERVEVRVSTASRHVVLVVAPEGDLAAEVFLLRTMDQASLPAPRLLSHDLSCAVVPFTYALQSYVAGAPLGHAREPAALRTIGRQVGRTLRRLHGRAAPGFGRPTTAGRWPARGWREALAVWLARRELRIRAEQELGAEQSAALLAATLDHPSLDTVRPCVIHGAVAPACALVTAGEHIQLEALVRPGTLVGGDPLFDLAHGLLPAHPAPFRQGLLEGYCAAGPLDAEQECRLARMRLLLAVADTLWRGDEAARAALPELVARGQRLEA